MRRKVRTVRRQVFYAKNAVNKFVEDVGIDDVGHGVEDLTFKLSGASRLYREAPLGAQCKVFTGNCFHGFSPSRHRRLFKKGAWLD